MEWVLIIFLKWGYAGGAITVAAYPTAEQCTAQAAWAYRRESVQDAFCISRPKAGRREAA